MIAKGNLHQHGGKLAAYLTTGKGGERAELVELRGFASGDIRTAFLDVEIQAYGTRCTKPFFHAYVRLAPGEELGREDWVLAADRIEKRLGFAGQPRAVSFHHLQDGSTHLHVAWSRIDAEQGRAIDPGLYKNKLKEICRRLENDLDLTKVRNERAPEDTTRAPGRNEFEQSRRLKTDLKAIRATIQECWERSDSGKSFAAALDAHGLILARGDRRDFVVIDQAGGDHALSKRITGATAAETRGRMADVDAARLPDVDEAKTRQHAREAARETGHAPELAAEHTTPETRAAEPGRADDTQAEFTAAGARATEPPAPIFDRDAADAAWMEKVAAAGITKDEAAHAAQEASRRLDERRAAREAARPPNAIESRIIECAEQARMNGAVIVRGDEGRRLSGAEVLADRFRPDGERNATAETVFGAEAFAARLDEAGITIARVTKNDLVALAALRRDEDLARLAAETNREAYKPRQFAELAAGELAAVTRNGSVHRINPDKLGNAAGQLSADRPSVTEARTAYETNREQTTALWAQQRAAIAAGRESRAADRETRAAVRTVEREARATLATAEKTVGKTATLLGRGVGLLAGLVSFLDGFFSAPKRLTPDQQHRAELVAQERAEHAATAAHDAAEEERRFRHIMQQAAREDAEKRERDDDRWRERER